MIIAVLLAVFEVAEVDHQCRSEQQRLLLPGRLRREVSDEVVSIGEDFFHTGRPHLLNRAHFLVI